MAVAAALVAPHGVWQIANGFPTLEFYANAGARKIVHMSALGYLGAQVTLAGPGNLLLWVAGLGWLLIAKQARAFRFLGVAYLALLVLFVVMHGKAYYLVPFYCVLFAAGGAAWEGVSGRARPTLAGLGVVSIVGLGCVTAPLAIPVLSPVQTIAHGKRLGISPPQAERAAVAELPQHLADMFGWDELVAKVAEIRDMLPEGERAQAQIVAGNYGEAAAVDWLGPARGLPRAHSPHNAYFRWGPPKAADGPVIVVGRRFDRTRLDTLFEQVTVAGRTTCDHCMPHERDLPVYLCRGWRRPPAELWPALKLYY